jgi:hypothetical protein
VPSAYYGENDFPYRARGAGSDNEGKDETGQAKPEQPTKARDAWQTPAHDARAHRKTVRSGGAAADTAGLQYRSAPTVTTMLDA